MRSIKTPLLAVSLLAGSLLSAAPAAAVCSMARHGFSGVVRLEDRAHFIGSATRDTVLAGAGSVGYREAARAAVGTARRDVFGQRVLVERIGGLAAARLRGRVSEVVLVPWSYGDGCDPVLWTESAVWVEPGRRGLFTAVLRDSAHWAGGVPTFDVFFPRFEPYPYGAGWTPDAPPSSPNPPLTVDELFPLMDLFPAAPLLETSPEEAVTPLFTWVRAHPDQAGRYPLWMVLEVARDAVVRRDLRALRSPLVGTYRFSVELSGQPERVLYVRTYDRPYDEEWRARGEPPIPKGPGVAAPPQGYRLPAVAAAHLASLPAECEAARRSRTGGTISLRTESASGGAGAEEWQGRVQLDLVARALAAFDELARFASEAGAALEREDELAAPARFVRSPDGSVRVEQVVAHRGRTLTLRGARVSEESLACDR